MVGFPSTWLEINPSRLDFQPLVRNPTAGWYSTHWMVRIPTILPLCTTHWMVGIPNILPFCIKAITSPPNSWKCEWNKKWKWFQGQWFAFPFYAQSRHGVKCEWNEKWKWFQSQWFAFILSSIKTQSSTKCEIAPVSTLWRFRFKNEHGKDFG